MAAMRSPRSVLKLVGISAGALAALTLIALALLQLSFVQRAVLEAALDGALAPYGFEAEVGATAGVWPWRIDVVRLELADSEGMFAELTDVEVRLRPLALLAGDVYVDRLHIGGGTYTRQPLGIESTDEPFRLPTLPSTIAMKRTIAVEDFSLSSFSIALNDAPVTVTGSGAFRLGPTGLESTLALIAGEAGHAALSASINAHDQQLHLEATIADPRGAWLAPLTPLAPGTPISARLEAVGPQENITLDAEGHWGAAHVQAAGRASWVETLTTDLSGSLSHVFGTNVERIAGANQTFETQFAIEPGGALRIEQFGVTSSTLAATFQGTLAREVDLTGEATVQVDQSRIDLQARLTGPNDGPALDLSGTAAIATEGGIAARDTSFALQADILREGRAANGSLQLGTAALSFEGLPPVLEGAPIELSSAFRANFAEEEITFRDVAGTWGPVTLEASGDMAAAGPMHFEGAVRAGDLSQLDGRLRGEGAVSFTARRSRVGAPLAVSLESETRAFETAGALARLIGDVPHLSAEGTITAALIQLETATLQLAAGQATAQGTYDRQAMALDVSSAFAIDDLNAVSADLSGAAVGEASISGPRGQWGAAAHIQSDSLSIRTIELRSVDARLDDEGTGGAFSLTAVESHDGMPLEVQLPYTREGMDGAGEITLRLAGLEVTGPLAVEAGTPRGDLAVAAPDIEALVGLIRAYGGTEDNVAAQGALGGSLRFEGTSGETALTLTGPAITGINMPAFAESIVLTANLDWASAPMIDGRLRAENVRFGPSRFSVIDTKAEGPFEALEASLSLRGPADDPFHLEANALRREAGAGSEITLSDVDGRSLDFTVTLASGGQLVVGPQGVELQPTVFAIRNEATGSEGALHAEGRLWAGSPYARLAAETVPAGALAVFGLPVDWTGVLNGAATLDARGEGPPLRVALRATELTNDIAAQPIDAHLTIDASGDDLEAQLSVIDGGGGTPLLVARSTMPLLWQQGQFAPAVDWDAPLTGFVRADAPLERLWPFVPLVSIGAAGALDADMTVSGTLGDPAVHGEGHLANGTVEHFRSGFLLRDLQGTLSFDQAGNLQARFNATDGNGGTAELTATAHLPRAENWRMDGQLRLSELMVARRDELRAQASGDLRLAGTLTEARLEGSVTMDHIDAQVPSQLPPSVVDLPVVRIDGDGEVLPSVNGARNGQSAAIPVALDVTIDVPRRAFVRGRGLDSEWNGQLALTGTARAPRLNGTISVVRGTFDLSRTRFDLTEGDIVFSGGARINPQVRVEGQAEGPDFTSIIRARGPASSPTLTITSDPVMPQETVMAQILFGKRPDELSAFELVQIGEATASLTGAGGFDFLGSARRATGLDVLSIGASETETGAQDVNITVGRYVAPNVFLGARQGFEPGSGAVTVEMEVTPQVTIDAEVRQDTEGSVGVDWRWDY